MQSRCPVRKTRNDDFHRLAAQFIDNLLQLAGDFVGIRDLAALPTNLRGDVFDDNDAVAEIDNEVCEFIFESAFTKEAGHSALHISQGDISLYQTLKNMPCPLHFLLLATALDSSYIHNVLSIKRV